MSINFVFKIIVLLENKGMTSEEIKSHLIEVAQ